MDVTTIKRIRIAGWLWFASILITTFAVIATLA